MPVPPGGEQHCLPAQLHTGEILWLEPWWMVPRAYKTPITISATVRKVVLGDSVALIHQDKVFGFGEVGRRLVYKSLDGFVQGNQPR